MIKTYRAPAAPYPVVTSVPVGYNDMSSAVSRSGRASGARGQRLSRVHGRLNNLKVCMAGSTLVCALRIQSRTSINAMIAEPSIIMQVKRQA
jgi:hypothetical protein